MKKLFAMTAIASAITLVGCDSGDIEIDATNNSVTTTTGGSGSTGNGCATYTESGVTFQGTYTNANCIYGTDFVSLTNPLDTDPSQIVTFKKLPNSGVHIFRDSLVVGRNYDNDADMATAGITDGGDGAIIQIEAGATLAFESSDDYLVINRGSQIFAEGEATDPITITSVSDAVDGTVAPEDVGEWGGMIINGFGVTNKCAYTGTRGQPGFAKSGECHVAAEGKAGAGQTHYGGDNDADNSGTLKYFIVKHTGAEVSPGNELNGIAFDAVGSGTTVDFLQAYATYDDGVEMFGGAVDINHYVALYVRDDSIDIDEGYQGKFDFALVIQSETNGQQCIESDGIGSYSSKDQATKDDFVARNLNSRATIKNLTCIVSPQQDEGAGGTGTHGVGAGPRVREAHFPTIQNALITTAYAAELAGSDNYCFRLESAEGLQAGQDGDTNVAGSVIACATLTSGNSLPNTTTVEQWLRDQGNALYTASSAGEDPTTASNPSLEILNGFYSLPVANMVATGATIPAPVGGSSFIGAVLESDDWTAGWAYGLDPANRGQALWFE